MTQADAPRDEWHRLGIPENAEGVDTEYVMREHEQRKAVMRHYLGTLADAHMHPDTRTLLLEIAACPGGERFMRDLAAICGGTLTKQTVTELYENGDYDRGLYSLFNKPY